MFFPLAVFSLSLSVPFLYFVEAIIMIFTLIFLIHNSSQHPVQNNLLFDTIKRSSGCSFTCCIGFILEGTLVELPQHLFFPQDGYRRTKRFLDKSKGFGALRMLNNDTVDELLSVNSVTEDATEEFPLPSLSTCATLQWPESSSSSQDSLLTL